MPILAGANMANYTLYLLFLITFMPLMPMNKEGNMLQVILNAPEYWTADGSQCDLDEIGNPCPMGPREQQLELKYVHAFPKLKAYLAQNENRFRGFDPKMFTLLRNCLQLSYLHQNAENAHVQAGMEKEIKHIITDNYSAGKLVDAVYVSRVAGLSLIEKLALDAFENRKHNGKPLKIFDVYPSFDSMDEVGPEDQTEELLPISYSNSDNESDEFQSKPQLHYFEPQSTISSFASFYAWIKSFVVFTTEKPLPMNISKELVRYKASPFAQLKFKKQPDSWFQKIKSWFALILWN